MFTDDIVMYNESRDQVEEKTLDVRGRRDDGAGLMERVEKR